VCVYRAIRSAEQAAQALPLLVAKRYEGQNSGKTSGWLEHRSDGQRYVVTKNSAIAIVGIINQKCITVTRRNRRSLRKRTADRIGSVIEENVEFLINGQVGARRDH